jgi:uncharacterized protein with GYD domain
MSTYIIFTRLSPDAFKDPKEFPGIAAGVSDRIKSECPQVIWKESFATSGRYDVVDVVESPDIGAVERACMIIRAYGHGTTETAVATPWHEFLDTLQGKKTAATVGTA